jgi:predicted nucleic acid-binding protein
MRYWDTSTLAKLYVSEPDSKIFETHLSATGTAVTSELARWELFRVAARKEAQGFVGAGTADIIFARFLADVAAGKMTLVPFDEAVESRYRHLVLQLHRLKPPLVARTLDCIHLATAVLVGAEEVVVTDAGFRKAAAVIGLKVFP